MEIELHALARSTLEEFANKHGLVMEIHERHDRVGHTNRFYAHFKRAEVRDGSVLIGNYGDGATTEDALAAYVVEISGKQLVVDAGTTSRREIAVPILTGVR